MAYQPKVYREQGGDSMVVADGGTLTIAGELSVSSGGSITAAGTQAANIAAVGITYSSNDPSITPDGAVTVTDGSTPTVSELLELAVELKANQDAIITALIGAGLLSAS